MRVFGIGKATLPAVVKTLVVPELRSSRPSALAPWFHQHRAPAAGPFCLHWQLDISYRLAKLTLLRINPQKGTLELNLDILYFSSSFCLEQ